MANLAKNDPTRQIKETSTNLGGDELSSDFEQNDAEPPTLQDQSEEEVDPLSLNGFMDFMNTGWGLFKEDLNEIKTGISQIGNDIKGDAPDFLTGLQDQVLEKTGTLMMTAPLIVGGLAASANDAKNFVVEKGPTAISDISETTKNAIPKVMGAVVAPMQESASKIMEGFEATGIRQRVSDTASSIYTPTDSLFENMAERGNAFVDSDPSDRVMRSAENILEKTVEAASSLGSPVDHMFDMIAQRGNQFMESNPTGSLMSATGNVVYNVASGIGSAFTMAASVPSMSSLTGIDVLNPIWREYELESVVEESEFLSTMVIRSKSDPSDRKLLRRLNKSFLPAEELSRCRADTERFRQIVHENICSIFHTHETPTELMVVMEYCDLGSLYTYQQENVRLKESEVAHIVNQTSSIVDYLHRRKFLYRDVKPQNIFLVKREDEFDIKLLWNPWIICSEEAQTLQAGTLTFVSPEMAANTEYSFPVDVWALGVTMYILLSGVPPFLASKREELYAKVKAGDLEFPDEIWENISREAQVLIKQMLKTDPAARIRLDLVPLSTFIIQHDEPLAG